MTIQPENKTGTDAIGATAAQEASPNQPAPVQARPGLKSPHFGITPAKMWTAFLFRWKIALFTGFVFALIGSGIAFATYKPKYTATASMRLTASKPTILPGGNDDGNGNRELGFQKLQTQLVKSRDVIGTVLKKDQIRALTTIREQPTPNIWLEKELQAGFVGGTDIFRIWLTGEFPEDLSLIVNAVQDVYLDQFVNYEKKLQAYRFDTVGSVMAKAEEKIRRQRDELSRLAQLHKTGDTQVLTLRQKMALEEFSLTKRELSTIESEMRKTVALLIVLKSDLKFLESEKVPANVVEEFMAAHPSIQKEQAEVNKLAAQIKAYSKLVTAESPGLRKLDDDLKFAKDLLRKARLESEPELTKKARAYLLGQKTAQVAQAEERLKVYREQYTAVAEQANHLGKEADKIGIGSFEIESRRAEIEEAGITLKKLRAEKERLEIEQHNTRDPAENKQEAEVPSVNQASLVKSLAGWSIAAFLLGCLGVSFLEARLHRLHQSSEVHQELGLHSLGVLPLMEQQEAQNYGRTLGVEQSVSSIMFADAVNALCTRLMCDDRLSKNAAIMLSSAGENEGKTMLATQMAIAMAHSGRKTLLLDCDFRKPKCHTQLGLAAGPGLCELLNGEVELKAALQTLPDSEARLITVGRRDPMIIKALSNGSFAELLTRLRQEFDCIIIDTAPTLIVSDGFLIGKMVDGVLLVVRSTVSKGPAVYAAYEQLTSLKIHVLGAVVNGIRGGLVRPYYSRKDLAAPAEKTIEQA